MSSYTWPMLWFELETSLVPYRLRYLNTWTTVGGTFSEGYGSFVNWRLARENTSQEAGFKGL